MRVGDRDLSYADAEKLALEALDQYEYGPNGRPLIDDTLADPSVDTVLVVSLVLKAIGFVDPDED